MTASGFLTLMPAFGAISNFSTTVLLYPIIFYLVIFGCYLLETYSLLLRDRKGIDLQRVEVGKN